MKIQEGKCHSETLVPAGPVSEESLWGARGLLGTEKKYTNGFTYKALFGAVFDTALVFTLPSVT